MSESARKAPSKVFATRLKDTRNARNLTQAELADLVTQAGRPMNKAALLRIERGERGLGLDEAFALTSELGAVPAQMLSPTDGEIVWLTDALGVDAEGMRNWLRFGDPLKLTAEGVLDTAFSEMARQLLVHAQALIDAHRGGDKAGMDEAGNALVGTATRFRREVDESGGSGFLDWRISGAEDETGEEAKP